MFSKIPDIRCAIPGRRTEGAQLTHRHPGLAPGTNEKATKPSSTPNRHPGLVPGPSGLALGPNKKATLQKQPRTTNSK